jgi:hypothetical protein
MYLLLRECVKLGCRVIAIWKGGRGNRRFASLRQGMLGRREGNHSAGQYHQTKEHAPERPKLIGIVKNYTCEARVIGKSMYHSFRIVIDPTLRGSTTPFVFIARVARSDN